jgi:hypothetical protein
LGAVNPEEPRMIRPIYRQFFEALEEGGEYSLARRYLRPNEAFFRPYVAFMSQGGMGWERFVEDFDERWVGSPEDVRLLSERVAGHDLEALARSGYRSAIGLLRPSHEPAAYLCVGLEMSNAFMVVVEGEPAVGIGLEAYGRTFGAVHVSLEDLTHVLPHELCHAVRARETDSPLGRFFESDDPATAFDEEPFFELVAEEGLAGLTGHAAAPRLPLGRVLFYAPDDLRWCQENEDRLLEEFADQRDLPLGGERYERYFGSGLEGDDRPPRTGYYLGYRLVRRYLEENPRVSLAEAVRMSAEQLLG